MRILSLFFILPDISGMLNDWKFDAPLP